MSGSGRHQRFSINPIELAIFCVVTVIFLNSVYQLFYDWRGYEAAAITGLAENSENQDRSPASVRSFTNLEIDCATNLIEKTTKSKIRLTGPLCGFSSRGQKSLTSTEIINTANQAKATVFTFNDTNRFSTDYIPLNTGENPIQISFTYKGGRVVSKLLRINREP